MNRARIRPTSSKRAAAQRQRVARLRSTQHGPQRCQWPIPCPREATDAHESLSRARGGDPLNPDWLLCRVHHDDVTSATGELLAWCIEHGLIRSAAPCERLRDVNETATVAGMAERRPIAARISPAADQLITDLAAEQTPAVSRAVVFRAMLTVASRHLPEVRAKIKELTE